MNRKQLSQSQNIERSKPQTEEDTILRNAYEDEQKRKRYGQKRIARIREYEESWLRKSNRHRTQSWKGSGKHEITEATRTEILHGEITQLQTSLSAKEKELADIKRRNALLERERDLLDSLIREAVWKEKQKKKENERKEKKKSKTQPTPTKKAAAAVPKRKPIRKPKPKSMSINYIEPEPVPEEKDIAKQQETPDDPPQAQQDQPIEVDTTNPGIDSSQKSLETSKTEEDITHDEIPIAEGTKEQSPSPTPNHEEQVPLDEKREEKLDELDVAPKEEDVLDGSKEEEQVDENETVEVDNVQQATETDEEEGKPTEEGISNKKEEEREKAAQVQNDAEQPTEHLEEPKIESEDTTQTEKNTEAHDEESLVTKEEEEESGEKNEEKSTENQAEATTLEQAPLSQTREWSASEDKLLSEAVDALGTNDWTAIAEKVGGGRDPIACSQHWYSELSPQIRTEAWSQEEDAILRREVERFGTSDWTQVAAGLSGRTDIQCRYRWKRLEKEEGEEEGREENDGNNGENQPEQAENTSQQDNGATLNSSEDANEGREEEGTSELHATSDEITEIEPAKTEAAEESKEEESESLKEHTEPEISPNDESVEPQSKEEEEEQITEQSESTQQPSESISSAPPAGFVRVRISSEGGQNRIVFPVGEKELGEWDAAEVWKGRKDEKEPESQTAENADQTFRKWTFDLPINTRREFKLVQKEEGKEFEWEEGQNRTIWLSGDCEGKGVLTLAVRAEIGETETEGTATDFFSCCTGDGKSCVASWSFEHSESGQESDEQINAMIGETEEMLGEHDETPNVGISDELGEL
ncbi:hypothetical protein BLNAU_1288 [Blattamonas nauphoetae]|uniref:Uncharacterized protein n=1 Tax=Blattamonas nauphoetae TaxID=2049346 RepID=A0ABQ9YIY4_9EUKA|nr:hypothetical protein BLNAU_1288 [Blattamonas nauphoetae]